MYAIETLSIYSIALFVAASFQKGEFSPKSLIPLATYALSRSINDYLGHKKLKNSLEEKTE